jgi:hypothetical protein
MNLPVYKYGLWFRLVEVADAELILSLRTDNQLARHLSATDNNIENQRNWIQGYKNREAKETEYYLIFGRSEIEPCGVIRLYDISEETFTYGSWLIKPGSDEFVAASSDLFAMQLGFEVLNLEKCIFSTRKANEKVVRYHRMFAKQTGEDDENYYFDMDRARYEYKKHFLSKIIENQL